MARTPTCAELEAVGLDRFTADELAQTLAAALMGAPALGGWSAICEVLVPDLVPEAYLRTFDAVHEGLPGAAAWAPRAEELMDSNLMELLCEHKTLGGIHRWSMAEPAAFRAWAEGVHSGSGDDPEAFWPGVHAHVHLELRPGDLVAWAGPPGAPFLSWAERAVAWNGASLLRDLPDPSTRAFGQEVSTRRVTHLAFEPATADGWIASGCMDGVDWSALRCMVSPGPERSPARTLWLMARASWRPVVELGMVGAQVRSAGSLVQGLVPAECTTVAVGVAPPV